MGIKVMTADLLRLNRHRAAEKIRHDPGAIAAVAMSLAMQGRRSKRRLAS
jgi:hypothetical protein